MEKNMIIKGICLSLVFPFIFGSCKSDNEPGNDNAWFRIIDNVAYSYDGSVVAASMAFPADEIKVLPYVKLKGEERAVTRIAEKGFADTEVKNIYIPSTIKEIGEKAFENTSVRELHLESLRAWCEINFYHDLHFYNYLETTANPINQNTMVYVDGVPI